MRPDIKFLIFLTKQLPRPTWGQLIISRLREALPVCGVRPGNKYQKTRRTGRARKQRKRRVRRAFECHPDSPANKDYH
jgi:hypothetical protein